VETVSLNYHEEILEKEEDSGFILEKIVPRYPKEISNIYYEGPNFVYEERAFKRVIRWKGDFQNIAENYDNVDWKILSAIIKVETQGKTGRQVSSAKAVGMPQIKYQGAWAFLWDAMFSKKIKKGSVFFKDYYNANIRLRYRRDLNRIRHYLEEKDIIVYPTNLSKSFVDYRIARSKTWEKLKVHLRRKFKPGEYQVVVDIAAMYIDHLFDTFSKIKKQVAKIKLYLERNGNISLDEIEFSGTKKIIWKRINEYYLKNVEFKENANSHKLMFSFLSNISKRLEDPNIYLAAYNFGIRKVLEYIESGRDLPKQIERYVKKVATYNTVLNTIENYSTLNE
jgi:hypothetical protein